MTPFELQDDLVAELESMFSDYILPTSQLDAENKTIMAAPKMFKQNLPIRQSDEESPFPYIIVGLTSGQATETGPHNVKMSLTIATYDENVTNQGHKDVLNIIQKIYERFAKNPILAKKYTIKNDEKDPIVWALQEDETYPYFFGGMAFTFKTPSIRRENIF